MKRENKSTCRRRRNEELENTVEEILDFKFLIVGIEYRRVYFPSMRLCSSPNCFSTHLN